MPSYSPRPFKMQQVSYPSALKMLSQESSSSPARSLRAWSPATSMKGVRYTRRMSFSLSWDSTARASGKASTVPHVHARVPGLLEGVVQGGIESVGIVGAAVSHKDQGLLV